MDSGHATSNHNLPMVNTTEAIESNYESYQRVSQFTASRYQGIYHDSTNQ